jgi:DNA repair protein RadD
MGLTLRDYQRDLIARARVAFRDHHRICLQAATGAGKTVMVAQMLKNAVDRGYRAWFIVHRIELVQQSVATFSMAADINTGVLAAGYPTRPGAPVQVCSVATLARRYQMMAPPDLLVFDEAHHVAANTWATIAKACPNAKQLGLTATPQRLDGRGLGEFFDHLITGPSTGWLIQHGFLSPYKLYAPSEGPSLDGVKTTGGDYNKADLAAAMDKASVTGDALAQYQKDCLGARALVFMWNVKASRELADKFLEAGIPAEHLDGDTDPHTRRAAMGRFKNGETRVLCNVDLFGEGLDVPAVDAVFLCRPTQSLGLYLQQIGRGLRPAPGKEFVRIFDHAGNWQRFGLPDDERTWSLDATKKRRKKSDEPAVRRCMVCFAVSPVSARFCPACLTPFPIKYRQIKRRVGELEEISPAERASLRMKVYRGDVAPRSLLEWQVLAKKLGYKPGWAWHQFKGHTHADRSRDTQTDSARGDDPESPPI